MTQHQQDHELNRKRLIKARTQLLEFQRGQLSGFDVEVLNWRRTVGAALVTVFGQDHHYTRGFVNLQFCLPRGTLFEGPVTPTPEDRSVFLRDSTIALGILDMALEEIDPGEEAAGPRDHLTGLLSRAAYDTQVAAALEAARVGGHPLSMVVLDIDKFKSINDGRGHKTGDAVLKEVATRVAQVVEGKGKVYRYGGEELAIVLPNHTAEEATAVAERMRRAIESGSIADVTVTASCGVGTFPQHAASEGELFQKADQAMYRAKDLGRNLVRIWGEPEQIAETQPRRKLPEPGALTEEQREAVRLEYFRKRQARCPRERALLNVYETQAIGDPTPMLVIHCPACGLHEQI